MKRNLFTQLTLAATIAILSTAALAHDDATLDKMKTPHNGQLRMSGIHHFELVLAKDNKVAKESPVDVYLTDHAGAKISSAGAKGSATILTGKSKVVVPITATTDNKLSGNGKYAYNANTKVIVSIIFANKTTEQARFTPSTVSPSDESAQVHDMKDMK